MFGYPWNRFRVMAILFMFCLALLSIVFGGEDVQAAETEGGFVVTGDAPAEPDAGMERPESIVKSLEQAVDDAVDIEAAAQKQLDAWNVERDKLLEEARGIKFELQWLELQQQKLERYVASNAGKIDSMEESHARYAVVSLALENILLGDLEQLEKSIASTPPYLEEERAARVRFLRQSLDDPTLSVGEKYRRFTEGLNVEVEYGKKLELTNQRGVLDGQEMDLILVRAGRVGYYCLTMDRKRAGCWDPAGKNFVSLGEDMVQAIRNIELMSQTQQYYNFAVLPALKEGGQ